MAKSKSKPAAKKAAAKPKAAARAKADAGGKTAAAKGRAKDAGPSSTEAPDAAAAPRAKAPRAPKAGGKSKGAKSATPSTTGTGATRVAAIRVARAAVAAAHAAEAAKGKKIKPPKELPKKSPYGKKELNTMRQRLVEIRQRIQGNMEVMGREALQADDTDTDADNVADHGSDAFERYMSIELMQNEAATLRQIEGALERMAEGRYGLCEECGEAIVFARLEALPFATTCVPCRERQERRGY